MEMSFPPLPGQFGASSMRPDFRALLSKAISRQANSPTARSMVHALRNPQDMRLPADPIANRISFFAGKRKKAGAPKTARGSFFPQQNTDLPITENPKQAVYQDGLANCNHQSISSDLSELLANNPGQETLRNL